jgi:aryl-alcohol dehydrogenase-like predicted oxidoreductase
MEKRRLGKTGHMSSIVTFGGAALWLVTQAEADAGIEMAVQHGINHIDVAPQYGQAEMRLGPWLEKHRDSVFLACKTFERSAAGARQKLEQSLRRLQSDHLDLYQFHAVNSAEESDRIFAPDGAMETFLLARGQGLIRFLGFSSHSIPAALSLLDRFSFDSVLFPVNFVCYARGNFGPQVLKKAQARGVARVALKALAYTPWQNLEARRYQNCWYRPIEDPALALQALRFSLSEDVSAVFPPTDERLYRMALELAPKVTPLSLEERQQLLDSAGGLKPIMKAKRKSSVLSHDSANDRNAIS